MLIDGKTPFKVIDNPLYSSKFKLEIGDHFLIMDCINGNEIYKIELETKTQYKCLRLKKVIIDSKIIVDDNLKPLYKTLILKYTNEYEKTVNNKDNEAYFKFFKPRLEQNNFITLKNLDEIKTHTENLNNFDFSIKPTKPNKPTKTA